MLENTMQNINLCSNCRNAAACTFRKDRQKFALYCEEFEECNHSQFCGDQSWVWGASVGCIEGINKEIINATLVPGTGGNNRPSSLAPAHADKTACALRYTPVNHNKSNCLFAEIIRWM